MGGAVFARSITILLTLLFVACAPAGYTVSKIPMYTPTQNLAVVAHYENGVCSISLQYTGPVSTDYSDGPKKMPAAPGIGSAVIDLAGFSKIDTVFVVLNFGGLEQFRIQTEESIFQIEVQKRPDEWLIYQSVSLRSEDDWKLIEPDSSLYTIVHIDRKLPRNGHLFELELPKAVWQDTSRPFDISWINFYR